MPISSAIPNLGNLWNALTNEDWSAEKRLQEVRDELLEKPLVYLGLPFGGGQLKKIYEGIGGRHPGRKLFGQRGGRAGAAVSHLQRHARPGRRERGAGIYLRAHFPAYGRDWIEGGFDTLGAKQTAVYQGLLEAGCRARKPMHC